MRRGSSRDHNGGPGVDLAEVFGLLWRSQSHVAILETNDYSEKIEQLLFEGLRLFRLNISGKSVLVKPNLVEDLPGPVNTNPALVGARPAASFAWAPAQLPSARVRDTSGTRSSWWRPPV